MVTRADFQAVASDIKDTFSDFFPERTFSEPDVINPVTGAETAGATEAAPAFRLDYDQSQFDGEQIRVGDFALLVEVADLTTIDPETDGVTVDVDGKECQVIRAQKDAADAMWTIQVRAL